MSWTFIGANAGQGLEAQYLRRLPVHGKEGAGSCPAISLKRDSDDRWVAWILEITGISARAVYMPATMTVREAQTAAEQAAKDAGWRW